MVYYSPIKRSKIQSFVELVMDLESVIQSEASQKEKNKYHILTCLYKIWKSSVGDPIWKAELEIQTMDTKGGMEEGGISWGVGIGIYTRLCMK